MRVAMKIKNIQIVNFKSIKDLNISLNEYGVRSNKSKSTFLVGINESGKSAILEAISLINVGFGDMKYDECCFLEAQEDNEYIDIYVNIEITNMTFWRKQIAKKISLTEDFVKKIEIKELNKNIYINEKGLNESYLVSINDNLPFFHFIVNESEKTVNEKIQKIQKIESLQEFNKIEEDITIDNAESFLKENQKLLTKDILELKISSLLKPVFNNNMPNIQLWKPKPEYLINEIINLEEFMEDTSISISLKNIFHIYGKSTDDDIKRTVERALGNQARSDELQEKMTDKVTRHINRIWKEHKIRIRISFNGSNCQVQVEDKDKKFTYYTMAQRSDGFKQFVSLILSLSAQNESDKLKNKIILIDEPEVQLHPSGVQYMRDEILKIGKNNNVIVATHSQYMVDVNTPERHWIVQKKKSQTTISQVDENTPIEDDKVLASAFGLNLFKELLPKNIIVVEGNDDKNIISHAIKRIKDKFFYSIKSAGGASKSPGFARLLNDENVPAFILFDADKEGKDNQKKILKEQGDSYSRDNVFILNDLSDSLPSNSTIEDLLPIDFVKSFFDREMGQSFTLVEDKAIIHQLKNQNPKLKSDKQKLDSLKVQLSEEFRIKYTKKSDITNIHRLADLTTALVNKIEST